MTDGDLDRAIDLAVREMMRVESPADVKARVLQRLRRSRRRLFTWPRLAFAVATGLLLVFAVLRAPRPTPVAEVASTPSVATPSRSAPATTTGKPVVPSLQASITAPNEFAPTDRQPEITPTIPPLEPIDPLVIEPPRPREIEPAAIVIAPLTEIPDVRVEPLFPAAGPQ